MFESRIKGKRLFGLGMALTLLVTAGIWQASVQTGQAQSVGAFRGAILELAPPDPQGTRTFGKISDVIKATPVGGTFYLEGNVYMNRTVVNCALPAKKATDTGSVEDLVSASFDPVTKVVSFDGLGRRVGVYRVWGVVRNPANGAGTTSTGSTGGQAGNNLTGTNIASVNISLDLESYNGTIQLQGTIGRVFGAIESAADPQPQPAPPLIGHPLTDILAITGGTGTFRGASGDADLTPLTTDLTNPPSSANIAGQTRCSADFFQIALREAPKLPTRFTNLFP